MKREPCGLSTRRLSSARRTARQIQRAQLNREFEQCVRSKRLAVAAESKGTVAHVDGVHHLPAKPLDKSAGALRRTARLGLSLRSILAENLGPAASAHGAVQRGDSDNSAWCIEKGYAYWLVEDTLGEGKLQGDWSSCSVYGISDLHTDHAENMEWLESALPPGRHADDVLVVAGDVSDDIRVLEATLSVLTAAFGAVFFIPGNHELWVRGNEERNGGVADSVAKLQLVLQLCEDMGVQTQPRLVHDLWIVPVHAWHHKVASQLLPALRSCLVFSAGNPDPWAPLRPSQSFDTEPDVPGFPGPSSLTISDYRHCSWPSGHPGSISAGCLELAQWCDSHNDDTLLQLIAADSCDVLSFSHFLPRQELLPGQHASARRCGRSTAGLHCQCGACAGEVRPAEKRFLYYPPLAKAAGSDLLHARLLQLQPRMHLFGHTHFAWDSVLDDGIRYLQVPLCYPSERRKRAHTVHFIDASSQTQPRAAGSYWKLPLQLYSTASHPSEAPHAGCRDPQSVAGIALAETPRSADPAASQNQAPSQMSPPQTPRQLHRWGNTSSTSVLPSQPVLTPESDRCSSAAQSQLPLAHAWHSDSKASCSYAGTKGRFCAHQIAHWSEHYSATARTPDNLTLAPWVRKFYSRRHRRRHHQTSSCRA